MPLSIPSREDVYNSLATYVRGTLPNLDPTPARRSMVGGWIKSVGSALQDWYVALRDACRQFFPQTATGDFLTTGWWCDITNLKPNPAAPSLGIVAFTGTPGTAIPSGTTLQANGITFLTDSASAIVTQSLVLSNLIYNAPSNTVFATTAQDHLLATGMTVAISGASESNYNGSFPIVVTDDNDFSYTPNAAPTASPATGARVSATWASASVTAQSLGSATNVSNGGTLTVVGSPTGVDTTALATFGGIEGGTDPELPDAFRTRVLDALGTDYGAFSAPEIRLIAGTVPGVTRVWVKEATLDGANGVYEGQVKIAFVRDNDGNIFPTAAEVAAVKSLIVAETMTANTAPEDVMVMSPVPHPIAIQVHIVPDSTAMRAAVNSAFVQWFGENANYETTVALLDLQCAIKGLVDPVTGAVLQSFSFAAPTTDTVMASNELPTLLSVSFV